MTYQNSVSKETRNNWTIDLGLFLSALFAILSGVYFLFLPIGGYQGGRNPSYGLRIIFERHTWDNIHTWTGIMMILVAVVHIILHWRWVKNMTSRIIKSLFLRDTKLNMRSWINAFINAIIGISFLIAAISGVFFLWFPGGRYGVADPGLIFSRNIWDLIHTWSGIALVFAAMFHLIFHWKWVVKVTKKVLRISVPPNKVIQKSHS